MKQLILVKNILTINQDNEILSNHAVEIEDGLIVDILPVGSIDRDNYDGDFLDFSNLTLIPGFVQTHVHLCQSLFRGLAEDMELLDWLREKIFPFENEHDKNSLRISSQIGIHEILKGGTTTILDMGTLNYQEIIFEELKKSEIRAVAGKCMLDFNDLYPKFVESTDHSLKYSYDLAKEYHNSNNGKLKYGFAPRFVLSCSEKLLTETKEMMQDFEGSIYHTHSSENKSELEAVKKIHNMRNIEYFDSINVLNDHTVLAHGIHVDDDEITILKNTHARISHCPSSNLKLGSGIADIPRYIREGIQVSLGADGAPCNNSLSQFIEMRLASLIQKPVYGPTEMDAQTILRMATIDGARALHLENEIGSIEIGKKADLVFLNLEKSNLPLTDENIYSSIIYSAGNENVSEVMIDGSFVISKGKSNIYDEQQLYSDGNRELNKLIARVY
ncbi:MAG: amidohydrolase family protein [Melioribacteraceae bacterium]|nr:amidohydrolase family protein [Melioribacteraceae bacterium]